VEKLKCPFLKGEVELTEERENHIAEQHPELLPEYKKCIIETLYNPDLVRKSSRFGSARLFSRWYPALRGGKHVVVVVLSELSGTKRNWIITAYVARKLSEGETEWSRD
jgi:hypothetical protein